MSAKVPLSVCAKNGGPRSSVKKRRPVTPREPPRRPLSEHTSSPNATMTDDVKEKPLKVDPKWSDDYH